ncbi:ABC transporter permease [Roseomonas aerophila]|uniref:ABC transporter permease n=1 Tax=Teichococcus aerophilus TaxID=1224513 RepID=A0ABR7RRP1_9PROT|nr:ABC transporter permease [Pseudoroseomonas aerophila]MBC9209284.1 ABC transporter permease [Pseudoroseomonas aerophila]
MNTLSLPRIAYGVLVALLLVFLLAPVLLVFPISFSADNFIAWPPSGWSPRWYVALARESELLLAFRNSVVLGLVVTVLSLAIALPAAVMLVRKEFPGRDILFSVFTAPLLLPSIVLGLAILIVFVGRGLVGSWFGMVLAHLTLTLPYALRVLATGLKTLPPAVEDAAGTLGARPFTVFRRVTLPLMAPALIAAGALSFLVSFDEVVISLFIVGPQLKVLPVSLYHYVESRTDPLVASASAVLILVTLLLVIVVERAVGLRKAVGGGG